MWGCVSRRNGERACCHVGLGMAEDRHSTDCERPKRLKKLRGREALGLSRNHRQVRFLGQGRTGMWLTLLCPCLSGNGGRHVSYTRREANAIAPSFLTLAVGKRTQRGLGTVQTDGIMTETGRELQVAPRWEPRKRDGLGRGGDSSQLISLVCHFSLGSLLLETDAGSHPSLCVQGLL